MAPLLLRLFRNRKQKSKYHYGLSPVSDSWKPLKFNGSKQVRALLFRECDWRGRKLLFDSSSVRKLSQQEPNSFHTQKKNKINCKILGLNPASQSKINECKEVTSDGSVYQYLKPSSDVKMLGEMIFGSVVMSYKGSTVKVHTNRSSSELMISIVFPVPFRNQKTGDSDLEDSTCLLNSNSGIFTSKCGEKMESLCVAHSVPVDVPGHSSSLKQWNNSSYPPSDSLYSSSSTSLCSFPDTASSSLSHSGSFSSLQRRWLQNMATSMDVWLQRLSEDSTQNEETKLKKSSEQSRTRLGLSLIISLEEESEEEERRFHSFFFSHIALIEGHINRLKDTVLESYLNRKNFVNAIYKGVEQLQVSLQDLFTGPRLSSPVWLSMMSPNVNHHIHCAKFISELVSLIEEFDTKYTNFFVSTLLTAVLTHHLAWVPTVTPSDVAINQVEHRKHRARWVDALARSHPYNPLWMQLGDLHGAIGSPTKLAKTVISGKKADIIIRFLFILSYFIRCSDIFEYDWEWPEADVIVQENKEYCKTNEQTTNCTRESDTNRSYCDSQHLFRYSPDERDSLRKFQHVQRITHNSSKEILGNLERDQIGTIPTELLCKCDTMKGRFWIPKQQYWKSCRNLVSPCLTKDLRHRTSVSDSELLLKNHNGFAQIPEDKGRNSAVFMVGESPPVSKLCKRIQEQCNGQYSGDQEIRFLDSLGYSSMEDVSEPTEFKEEREDKRDIVDKKINDAHKHIVDLTEIDNLVTVKEYYPPEVKVEHVKNTFASAPLKHPKAFPLYNIKDTLLKSNGVQNFTQKSGDCSNFDVKPLLRNIDFDNDTVHPVREVQIVQNKKIGSETVNKTKQYFETYHGVGLVPELKCTSDVFTEDCVLGNLTQESHKELGSQKVAKAKEKILASCHCSSSKTKDFLSVDSTVHEEGYQSLDEKPVANRNASLGAILRSHEENPLEGVTELPLPQLQIQQDCSKDRVPSNFGWSLFAGVSDHYMTDFCLQGVKGSVQDLNIRNDLITCTQSSVLGDPVAETVCILADTDQWSVRLVSSNREEGDKTGSCSIRVGMSPIVSGMCESVVHLCKLKLSPEFCLMHLEDKLQELYIRSKSLSSYLADDRSPDNLDNAVVVLGFDRNDLPLLMSVALTHAAQFERPTC
ncbi:folliculin-interacting protein 2-like isoform X2 [Tachypleus tridentatus]|uniref:folliculin-interacting protein 2-like isoform X2 n=2 Tax=Tachypleus tridentatus TaxID=6853 RepID=UPI003FD4E6BF